MSRSILAAPASSFRAQPLSFWAASSAPRARLLLAFLVISSSYRCCCAYKGEEEEAMKQARLAAKPWFVRNISYGGVTLPVSYATVVVVSLSMFYLFYYWGGGGNRGSYAVASHILLEDPSDRTQEKMMGWKQKIGNDPELFAKCARENSICPSKNDGGRLGKFPKHAMAPPFDRACFDPASPVGTTIGPIQTQFGWHLIYIHDRKI